MPADGVNRTQPIRLYDQAEREHPTDKDARQRRYLDLLHEHGHIVCRSCESPLTTWDAADGWSCRACGRTDADE